MTEKPTQSAIPTSAQAYGDVSWRNFPKSKRDPCPGKDISMNTSGARSSSRTWFRCTLCARCRAPAVFSSILTSEEQVETVDGQDGETDGAVAVGGVAHVGWVEPLERDGMDPTRCGVRCVVSLSSAWNSGFGTALSRGGEYYRILIECSLMQD